ncbi:hypothetical protein Pmar_PMAR023004 [Perkinsus marinus ATCC 50983]|uniref:Uncharacterized protein n=1 Tax=Perkinsus marinus (strain ATCC 50983 / TXsc) TaxID=423536 RepID=C5LHV3_PERM5|nr:hypothetical protein Pmar_PMAR023004 [Perkinsus marinus ATCC 50983]EER03707.1 hypothetical protein Pmar_PMAR023004 [Perkinsus marinus ATCC 50983]|eukprot:XP_002771891.1 hypothetical protein Pmar_PMAR023004 [Perkinsus marinus ATCC 50983]
MISSLVFDPRHMFALHLMLVDFLWDKDDLGKEELGTILKQFVGRRDVSIRVVEPPVTLPPADDIFCRGTSLIGLRSKMRMQGINPRLMRDEDWRSDSRPARIAVSIDFEPRRQF